MIGRQTAEQIFAYSTLVQWCSQGQNCKAKTKTKATALKAEAEATTLEVKADITIHHRYINDGWLESNTKKGLQYTACLNEILKKSAKRIDTKHPTK